MDGSAIIGTSAHRPWHRGLRLQAAAWLRGLSAEFGETASDVREALRRRALGSAPPGGTVTALSQAIIDRQFRTMMLHTLPNLVATFCGFLLFLVALWFVAPSPHLALWGVCTFSTIVYTVMDHARFRRSPPTEGSAVREWGRRNQRELLVYGVIWGSVMFLPVPWEAVPYMTVGLLLLIAGSVSLFTNYRPGISLIAAPCTLLTSTALILSGDILRAATGLGFVVAVTLMIRLARIHNAAITQAMIVAEERKALVEELNVQRREAEHASLAKTFFLASVSHDLRQPMHSIALLVAAARRHGGATVDTVEQIGASVQSMEDLLSALLEVSKLDTGAVPLQMSVFPVGDLLERVRLQFGPQARAKGLSLDLAASPLWVHSDFFQLERIVSNLVANAIRYTRAGRVRLRCRQRGPILWVQVWDSGIGIARQHRGRIFEDFFQVSRGARSGKQGLGLGLSIVQRTAHRLNLGVRVRSRPGRGSLFEVGVPVESAGTDRARAIELAPLLDGQLVLLIDDDPMILKSMSSLLKAFNCQVLSAGSLDDALAVVDETLRLPDLIISDYRLGDGRTGLEAIRQVHALAQEDIPALLVTAEPNAVPADSTATPVLAKPLRPDALAAALQRLSFGREGR